LTVASQLRVEDARCPLLTPNVKAQGRERKLNNELSRDVGRSCQSNVAQCQDKLCSKDYFSYAYLCPFASPGVARSGGSTEQTEDYQIKDMQCS